MIVITRINMPCGSIVVLTSLSLPPPSAGPPWQWRQAEPAVGRVAVTDS